MDPSTFWRLQLIEQAAEQMVYHHKAHPNAAMRGNPEHLADGLLHKAVEGLEIRHPLYALVIALRESWGLPLA